MDASAPTPPSGAAGHPNQHGAQGKAAGQAEAGNPWLVWLNVNVVGVRDWWTKVRNDWVFNLAGLLAYSFLMSVFPILLVLLAIAGFFLNQLGIQEMAAVQNMLNSWIPGGATVVAAVTNRLKNSAGILFAIGVVTALITGSRLFIAIESCFSIIFRLRPRSPIRQNLMAFGMLLLYTVLIPIIALGSVIPSTILRALGSIGSNSVGAFLVQVASILFSVAVAYLFLFAIYIVVPNRRVRHKEVWKGTLAAAALLVIYNLVFPFYQSVFLRADNYGSVAGFAIVILVFFYYLGFILLIGAEINSWAAGQRQTAGDIAAILHEVQAHDTTRGAAGPTAGLPQEDLAHHRGADAMRDTQAAVAHEREDHARDIQPAAPAEAHLPGPPHLSAAERRRDWEQADEAVRAEHAQRPGSGAPASPSDFPDAPRSPESTSAAARDPGPAQ